MSASFFKEATDKATPSDLFLRADELAKAQAVAKRLPNVPEKYRTGLDAFVEDLSAAKAIFEGSPVSLKV